MAKSKRSSALFEVMNKAGKAGTTPSGPRPKRSGFATPGWWFKKSSTDAAPPVSPVTDAASATPLRVDRDTQKLSFSMSFTSAIVLAVALVVVIALAVVLGQQLGSQTQRFAPAQPSSSQLQNGLASPAVGLVRDPSARRNEIPGADAGNESSGDPAVDAAAQLSGGSQGPAVNPGQSLSDATQPPASLPLANGPREVNLNYMIFQSYPDEASAKEIVELLAKNGIGATVERKLRGFTANWHSVVGTQGFVRARGPEYEAYMAKVRTVNEQLQKQKKNFKVFTSLPYKWDKPASTPR